MKEKEEEKAVTPHNLPTLPLSPTFSLSLSLSHTHSHTHTHAHTCTHTYKDE